MKCGLALVWPRGQRGTQPGKQIGTNEVLIYSIVAFFFFFWC